MSFIVVRLLLIFGLILIAGSAVQDFYWRDYAPGDVPCDAYEAAPGRYIGQIIFEEHTLPAMIYTHSNTAFFEYDGKRTSRDLFQILCSPNNNKFYWESVDFKEDLEKQLVDAVQGGYEFYDDGAVTKLFVGKQNHAGEWKIGKVLRLIEKDTRGLWIWDDGQPGVNFYKFEILKYNTTDFSNEQCHAKI